MIKFYPTIKALLLASFILALATAAQAQATRTWVSGVGDDLNPCSRTAPCKTFAGAISKTAKDGEMHVLLASSCFNLPSLRVLRASFARFALGSSPTDTP